MKNNVNNILIPNISKLPNKSDVSKLNIKKAGDVSDFEALLNNKTSALKQNNKIEFSKHALKRIDERKMNVDGNEYLKLQDAMGKLKAKGGKESLVITKNGAYILDVNKGRVVTAMDKEQLKENVFTKIDSTLFLN